MQYRTQAVQFLQTTWYHWAYTRDRQAEIKEYLNGTEESGSVLIQLL